MWVVVYLEAEKGNVGHGVVNEIHGGGTQPFLEVENKKAGGWRRFGFARRFCKCEVRSDVG